MKRPYIIWSLSIKANKGNGPRVLHLLSKALNKRGYDAYMYTTKPYTDGYVYCDKITEELKRTAIVVYPEIVYGNPLQIQNVTRYVLNTPGLLGGNEYYHKCEAVFTWDKKFLSNVPELMIPFIDTNIFYNDNSPKTQDCVFVHKKGKFRSIPEIDKLTEINMHFPEKREELGKLLRCTGTLYSYDNCSAIINEAQICGAKVKIITENSIIDAPANHDLERNLALFDARLSNFIDITQGLDYKGVPEPIVKHSRFCYCFNSMAKIMAYLCLGHKDQAVMHKDLLFSMAKYGNYGIFR